MNKSACLVLSSLVAAAWPAAAQTAADLTRCRAIADGAARLACYDAIVPAPAVAAPPKPGVPAAVAVPAAGFGFESQVVVKGVDSLETRIEGLFEGWGPRSRIKLANGQVWQVVDDSRAAMNLRDPKVRLTRGTFGTFFLEIEGRNQAPRVKRVE